MGVAVCGGAWCVMGSIPGVYASEMLSPSKSDSFGRVDTYREAYDDSINIGVWLCGYGSGCDCVWLLCVIVCDYYVIVSGSLCDYVRLCVIVCWHSDGMRENNPNFVNSQENKSSVCIWIDTAHDDDDDDESDGDDKGDDDDDDDAVMAIMTMIKIILYVFSHWKTN